MTIEKSLNNNFISELFYQAIISDSIQITNSYVKKYIESHEKVINGKPTILFNNVSPNTGIPMKFREPLNKLVTIIYKLNDKAVLNNDIIIKIKQFNPYYLFILNLDKHLISEKFNIYWLLENQSKVVLEILGKNEDIKVRLKEELSLKYNEDLGKLYFNYFTK
ncbi:hypothetical protein [Olleya sp. Bg11-27]|uniref:hypothetical protein n=1 Tax=Olleya sp. Bg11-27 TaxID=2058135 RepID=UPI000C3160C0|nr:hypothetical protein [Olleya sp. Bg11-27]AUC75691.1 hypothetical protein CW732_08395 [Olleya sp. Bg11-27]